MVIIDFIIYIYYKAACVIPFWDDAPYLGCSLLLAIPNSMLLTRILRFFDIDVNSLIFLIFCLISFLGLYPIIKKKCIMADERFGHNRLFDKWWICAFLFLMVNAVVIIFFFL